MHSLLLTDSSTLLIGGLQSHILEMDLNTVQETQKVEAWGRRSPRREASKGGGRELSVPWVCRQVPPSHWSVLLPPPVRR